MDKVTKARLEAMNRAAAANAWLAHGYFPMPVMPGEKATRYKHAPWLEKLSDRAVDVHWSTHPTDDIALHCGQGLTVLDADSPESLEAMLALEAKHDLHPKLVVKTKKGVHHYFRQASDLRIKSVGYSTTEHPERIDIRCGSAYIIAAPSTGKTLVTDEVVKFEDLTVLTQAFVDDLMVHNGDRPLTERPVREPVDDCGEFGEPVDVSVKVARMRAMLEHIDPDDGYSSWVQVLMAIHHETGGSDEGLALADEWSSKGGSYDGFRSIESKWASFNAGSSTPVTMATIASMVRDQGLDWMAICDEADDPFESCGEMEVVRTAKPRLPLSGQSSAEVIQAVSREGFPHQASRSNAALPATFENFSHLMRSYGVQMSYDMVRKDVLIKVPHLSTTIDNSKDVTKAHIKSLCALNGFPITHIDSNILALADLNAVNPVAEWIMERPWDGVDRLPGFRDTLVTDDDYPVHFRDTLLDRWMTSAVAAVFDDDFRSRGVLTLSGPQGIGKTSWVNALVSCPELRKTTVLTGHSLDANSRDSKSTAITKWITELGEVEATLKHDLPAFKAFITNDIDVFRRPYASADSTMPRRTVFCASVNDKWYLKDPTGNSRFWSINVTNINYAHGLDMQQVFAQYKVQFFDQGAGWWLDPEQEKFLTELNKEFEPISPVKEALTLLINQGRAQRHDPVFMTAVQLIKLIDMRATSKEVHAVMRELVGPARKTKGLFGWDVPLVMSLD